MRGFPRVGSNPTSDTTTTCGSPDLGGPFALPEGTNKFMGSHPANLAVRFVLEITGLVALGWWGWNHADGVLRFVLALGIPVLAAAAWGTFAVPGDPSRSGRAPVPVSGIVRVLLELAFFASATWVLRHGCNDAGVDIRHRSAHPLRCFVRSSGVAGSSVAQPPVLGGSSRWAGRLRFAVPGAAVVSHAWPGRPWGRLRCRLLDG